MAQSWELAGACRSRDNAQKMSAASSLRPGDDIAFSTDPSNKYVPHAIRVKAADQRRFLGMVPWCELWRFIRFAVPHPSTHGFHPLEGGQQWCAELFAHYTQANGIQVYDGGFGAVQR